MRKDSVSPINTEGNKPFFEIKEISVNEWHPLPDGKKKPEQVHLWFEVEDIPYPFVLRFKSRRPVDELIVALMTHAKHVWPKGEYVYRIKK
jgi:hypothetical protein